MLFKFNQIAFNIGPDKKRQLSLSGQIDEGEVLVVRGPSGSGKSTLLRVLSRLQECAGGESFLKGESWRSIPATAWRASVHYLAQRPVMFDGTVADNMAIPFGARVNSQKKYDTERARSVLGRLMLDPGIWSQDAKTLSGGEAARVAFARSLTIDPAVLVLDEPTAALDEKSQGAFYGLLAEWLTGPGKCAILVSHNNDYGSLRRVSCLDIKDDRGGQ